VSEEPTFDVVCAQRLVEEWIVDEVDLPDREIVRGTPVQIEGRRVERSGIVDVHRTLRSRLRVAAWAAAGGSVGVRIGERIRG
jgi:hypothetical protein